MYFYVMKPQEILQQIIQNRKSIFPKDYSQEAIPDAVLEEILSSTQYTPNHKRTKPWRFQIFRGEEKHLLGRELQEIYKETTASHLFLEKKYQDIGFKVEKSDAVITIVVNFSGLVPEWEEIAATAMAVQNMYLTCTVNNIGCYWSSPKYVELIKNSITIEENQKCLGLFYLGMMPN